MKKSLKIGLSLVAAAALVLTFVSVNTEPVGATLTCPSNHCPQDLDGYTYLGPCVGNGPGGPCLGWAYKQGSQTCHVSAEGGL